MSAVTTYDSLKTPPHSVEAEQGVLGGIMMSNEAWALVADKVTDVDFYREDHRLIFRALKHLAEHKQPMDIITMSEFLKGHDKLDDAGGMSYLATMAKDTPSAVRVGFYADIVRNKSSLRNIMSVAQGIYDAALLNAGNTEDVKQLVEESTAKMFELELRQARSEDSLVPLKPVIKERLGTIQELAQQAPVDGKRPLLGLSTGLDALDQRYSGLQSGKTYVIAARPGMGKTTLGLNIVEHVGTHYHDKLAVVFSAEMQREELADKFLSSAGRVQFNRIRDPWDIMPDDWPNLAVGVKAIAQANIYVDDQGGYTIPTIRSRARRLMRDTGMPLGVLMIDYLQLLRGEKRSYPNRNEEIGEISRQVKQLSKDLNTPILLLSQLNRAVTNRASGIPVLSDLRESGDIEQDADVVLFIHREDEEGNKVADLVSAKVRAGQTGTDSTVWNGQFQRFDNYIPDVAGAGYAEDYV